MSRTSLPIRAWRRAALVSLAVSSFDCGLLISADDLEKVECIGPCSTTSGGGAAGAGGADAGVPRDAPADRASLGERGTASDAYAIDSPAGDVAPDRGDGRAPILQHAIFVSSRAYTGNFVAEANALGEGPFTGNQGIAAADALCQYNARRAGRSGTFIALLSTVQAQDAFSRVADTDGPWALTDGTPVAERVSELVAGQIHHTIDLDERGLPAASHWTWAGGWPDWNCISWNSTSASDGGVLIGNNGQIDYIGYYFYDSTGDSCTSKYPLYCLQVGGGGVANTYPYVPADAKIAFVTAPRVANFAYTYAMGLGMPSQAPILAHDAADALCAAEASAAGKTAVFRAWISTSSAGAGAYFMSHAMDGPWYRADGFEIAANRAELTSADGIRTQIALRANGTFASDLTQAVITGDDGAGQLGSDNCKDFTSRLATDKTTRGRTAYKGAHWASWSSVNTTTCDQLMSIYCFQE